MLQSDEKWSLAFVVAFVSTTEYTVALEGKVFARVYAELGLCGNPGYWSVRYQDYRTLGFDSLADAVASAVKRKGAELLVVTPRTAPETATTHDYVDAQTEPHSPHCPHCIVAAAERS